MRTVTSSDLRSEHADISVILLDLDGVVTNFIRSAARVHGYDEKKLIDSWPRGTWDIERVIGVSLKDFLTPIEALKESFWEDMEVYDYADELFKVCQGYAHTFICTAQTGDPYSASGKVKFLKRWRGPKFSDFILTMHKELLARPDHLLIDDKDANITAFRGRHGKAILFPQIFNSMHAFSDKPMEYVRGNLAAICH